MIVGVSVHQSVSNRYWYDNRPTLRKTAEDRAQQYKPSDVEYEIETRLANLRGEKPFAGLHTFDGKSSNSSGRKETSEPVFIVT